MNHAQQKTKKRFVLTMRNQKGQVGIFVALIFQVIFVFFAMLVNVGLVVHHKINLQQSTDLAAYYGAMKQAEIMNVMAHVNYQIRQAWKLFAWRYRVLGTFGVEKKEPLGAFQVEFPITWGPTKPLRPKFNESSVGFTCPHISKGVADGVTVTDVPFMCMGHNGFADWISATDPSLSETYCKMDCKLIDDLDQSAFKVTEIPSVNTGSIYGNTMGASVQQAIGKANDILKHTCKNLGPYTTQMLALYYGNYLKDTANRRDFIYMLARDLGLSEDKMLDIEGKSVLEGVRNTLKNNLTEANLSSMTTDTSIATINSVRSFNGGTSFAEGMLRQITFERLMFYLIDCTYVSGSDIKLKSLYKPNTLELDTNVDTQLAEINPTGVDGIRNLFMMNQAKFNTIGFEKNPWIQVYYGVKATAEPKIPFLPLGKIKLHAVSFAKPFGGTIGPWYYKTWPSGSDKSEGPLTERTDINLPVKTIDSLPSGTPNLKQAREFFPNYSTYVGDDESNGSTTSDAGNKGGLANSKIVAFYHNILANKYGKSDSEFSAGKKLNIENSPVPVVNYYNKPNRWPKYADWYHLGNDVSNAYYDPLAVDRQDGENAPRNSYMRDIELSVVAPNQFDVTYYSIEPDFHRNYVEKLTPAVIQKISDVTGTSQKPYIPLDFGDRGAAQFSDTPKPIRFFGVRQQLEVTKKLFKDAIGDIISINGNSNANMRFAVDVIATRQSSVLTGWTFLNLTDTGYKTFPAPDAGGKNSMLFGTCDKNLNPWSEDFHATYDEDANLPPVPGNCVTGGRTGYSVKIISSDTLRETRKYENLGGSGQEGEIKNPIDVIDPSFLQF